MPLDDLWIELVRRVQLEAPIRPDEIGWRPEEIVLAKGCDARPHEAAYCERLIAAFPDARVTDARDTPHNRVKVPGETAVERIDRGKRMLVLGAMGRPVSRNCDPEAEAGVGFRRGPMPEPTPAASNPNAPATVATKERRVSFIDDLAPVMSHPPANPIRYRLCH